MNRFHRSICFLLCVLLLLCSVMTGCGQTAEPAERIPEEEAAPAAELPPVYTGLVISEFMEKNKAVLPDEDGDFSDWIELYNSGSESVSLALWRISDKENKSGWEFPDVVMAPGERLVVFASGKDRCGAELHTDFSVGGDEDIYLRDPNGTLVYEAPCGGCRGDVAMACIGGVWQPTLYPTPGFDNSAEGYGAFQDALTARGPLVINEAAVSGMAALPAGNGESYDWVEIKNISDTDVELSNYRLSDDDDDYFKYTLPETVLPAGGIAVFLCGDRPAEYSGKYAFTDFSLDSAEEQLYLADADGVLLDFASLRDIPYSGSYGRMDGENGRFFFASPTPGGDNAGGKRRVAQTPVSLSADGVFNGIDSISAELSGEGTIRYTLDGSMPTENSAEYTEPIELTKTCAVRAVSTAEDALPSLPLTLNFILNENHTLPVFCLNTDDVLGFRLMYDGMHKGEEQPGALSMYREDGCFTIGCGVSLNGETSLTEAKKNMSLRFRGAYGQETLTHDIYGGGVTEFTNLLLRAGQDYKYAIIRNELAQSLCDIAGCRAVNQRSIYGILYTNGQYCGIYTLKEKANEQLYASLAGVSRDSVELYEAPAPYQSSFYQDVIHFVNMNDMTKDENYEHFCSLVDIDSLIDWAFIEGFCANTDLTSGNLRYCKSDEADGKWHFMFYDLDAAFKYSGSVFQNILPLSGSNTKQFTSVLMPLMENEQFRDRFLTRASELLTDVLTNEAVLAEIDRLAAEVAPEVSRDFGLLHKTASEWERNLELMRSMIADRNWRQLCINALSTMFDLTKDERAFYFGDIDGK